MGKLMLLMYGDGVDKRDLFHLGAFYFYAGEQRPNDPWAVHAKRTVMSVFKELHDATGGTGDVEHFDLSDAADLVKFKEEIGWGVLVDESDAREDDDYEESGKRED